MAQKKLETNSQYEKYDLDGDGVVTDEEFEMDQKLVRLENEDKRGGCLSASNGVVCTCWYVIISHTRRIICVDRFRKSSICFR